MVKLKSILGKVHLGLIPLELQPSEAALWDQKDLYHKLKNAPGLEDSNNDLGLPSIHILDNATLVKLVIYRRREPIELHPAVLNMQFVYEHTSIPIPNVYMVAIDPDIPGQMCIVMDYIHGQRLDRIWPQLSIWSKLRVAWILRSYIRQQRRIKSSSAPIPGSIGSDPRPYPEGTIDFLRQRGPFPNATELNTFLNSRSASYRGSSVPREYEAPAQLVFTHADLNMRNVILGDDGRVWLIDWDWSGYYPKSWEFLSTALQAEAHPLGPTPLSWQRCVPFITDPDFGRYRWSVGALP